MNENDKPDDSDSTVIEGNFGVSMEEITGRGDGEQTNVPQDGEAHPSVPSTPREMEMYMKGQADMAERIQLEQDAAGQAEPTVQIAVRPHDSEAGEAGQKYDVIATANVGNGHVVQVKESCVLNGITIARDNAKTRALAILATIRAED